MNVRHYVSLILCISLYKRSLILGELCMTAKYQKDAPITQIKHGLPEEIIARTEHSV